MTAPKVSHHVEPQGVRLTVRASTGSVCVPMTDSEAKRLAWGILNDLDPDAVYVNDRDYVGHKRASSIEWASTEETRAMKALSEEQIAEIIRLHLSGMSLTKMAIALDINRSKITRTIERLRNAKKL